MTSPLRIKITTCTPSPYQVELFDAVARRAGLKSRVLYWRSTTLRHLFDLNPGQGHEHRILPGFYIRLPFAGKDKLCPGIIAEVAARDYDAFIVAGIGPTAMLAMGLLRLLGRPWMFWGERIHPPEGRRLKDALKRWWWRWVSRNATGILAIGKTAVEDFERFGAPRERIANVPYSPDLEPLIEPSEEFHEATRNIRSQIGAEAGAVLFLFCGMLIRRKGVDLLLSAFERCAGQTPGCHLMIVGDGPDRAELEARIASELRLRVHFVGTKQRPELSHYYLAADVFVFPSRYDGWGVVINEAMGAGLAVISTDCVGAALEMMVDGENGFLVPPEDVEALSRRMIQLAQSPALRECMTAANRLKAREYSAQAGAKKMEEGVRKLLGLANPRTDGCRSSNKIGPG